MNGPLGTGIKLSRISFPKIFNVNKGPFIYYVSMFWAFFDPPTHLVSKHKILLDPPYKLRKIFWNPPTPSKTSIAIKMTPFQFFAWKYFVNCCRGGVRVGASYVICIWFCPNFIYFSVHPKICPKNLNLADLWWERSLLKY